MSAIDYGRILGALVVTGSVAMACGGVDKGRIDIVAQDGGSGGSAGKSGGSGGNSSGAAGSGAAGEGEGGEGKVPVLPEPPVVVSVTPGDGEGSAQPTDSILIEFSEGLDPDTVTSDSVVIFDEETPVPGTLDYSGVTVEFTPDQRLDLLGDYRVVVTTQITDAGGTAMAEDFSSSFTVRDGEWQEELLVQNAQGALNRTLVGPVIDGNGNALIVWGQAKPGEALGSVFGRRFSPGEGFSEPFEIDQTTAACAGVSLAMNAAGEAIVAWTEARNGVEEVWARRLTGAELAASAERVASGAATVGGTLSAVSTTGEAHVFWWFNDTAGATKQNLIANHAAPGEDWLSSPPVIYNYADTLSPPAVAFDADGNGFVFFAFDYLNDMLPGRLYARRYLQTNGQWGNGVVIDGTDGVALYDPPSAVTDADGGARAVVAVGQDVKTITFSKATGFSAASTIDVLDTPPNSAPKLSSNGSRFLASWYQTASSTANAYSALSNGGAFADPELRSSGDYQVGYYGNAVSGLDRRGNGLVLFEQGNAADTVDIVFGRLAGSEWFDGVPVNSLEGQYQDPRVAVAANGVAIAAWSVGIRLSADAIYVATFE